MDLPSETFSEEIAGIVSLPLFSAELCSHFIEQADSMNRWESALIHGGHDGDKVHWVADSEVRKAMMIPLNSLPDVSRHFNERFQKLILPFIHKSRRMQLKEHAGAQVIRYSPGGHYEVHADSGPDLEDRYFSIVCYLNDDFVGGATSFPTLNHSVHPQCGKAIIFPSEYLHQAEPVISGSKYAIVTWVVGTPPVTWI